MDAEELGASEDSNVEESASASPSKGKKAVRGTNKRGRGKQKRTRKVSSGNESTLNGNQQVGSLKHVGKFRYLSSLTQSESGDEMAPDSEKPVTTRGRGRGRGRARGRGFNHVITQNHAVESSSNQVSRSGRRIKPNNRWAPDSDFDSIASKTPPVRTSNRGRRSAKVLVEQKIEIEDSSETTSISVDTTKEEEINISSESSDCGSSNHIEVPDVPSLTNGFQPEKIEEAEKDTDLSSAISNVPLDESSSPAIHKEDPQPSLLEEDILIEKQNEVNVEKHFEEAVLKEEKEMDERTAETSTITEDDLVDTSSLVVDETIVKALNSPSILMKKEADFPDPVEVSPPNELDDVDCKVEDDPIAATEPSSDPIDSHSSPLTETDCKAEIETMDSMCNGDKSYLLDVEESTVSLQDNIVGRSPETIEPTKKDSVAEQSSAENTPGEEETFFDAQSMLILPIPVKVKSRWRRTSELEQVVGRNGSSEHGSSCNNSPLTMSPKAGNSHSNYFESPNDDFKDKNEKDMEKTNAVLIEERLKSFEHMEENLYLTSKKTSKEVKRMLCDCTLSKEEISRNEVGCGEDCINRLLMIEWLETELKTCNPDFSDFFFIVYVPMLF